MADAKIEFKVGGLTFAGEGTEAWLGEQLEKLLAKAADLAATTAPAADPSHHEAAANGHAPAPGKPTTTLAGYLSAKNATSKQVRRFLATAEWLTQKGQKDLKTTDVSKALADNHQKRLGNPSDCLIQNVSKGFCEKKGNGFFVTDDGRASLN